MSQKRKTHFLLGSISTAFSAKTATKNPYWTLHAQVENLYNSSQEKVYVFANLVPLSIVHTLKTQSYQGKKYYLECEKRVRGWRLVNWKEV